MLSSNISTQIDSLVTKLKSSILRPKDFSASTKALIEQTYRFWHQSWCHTFSEIGKSFQTTSDEFLRHNVAVILELESHIVACVLLDQFDLNNPLHIQHKYFSNYSESVLTQLKILSNNHYVSTAGYLTVSKDYRGCGLSDLVLGIAIKYFLSSNNKLLITYTRNSRKTNELTHRLGANTIEKNLMVNGEPSDFVYFDQLSELQLMQSPYYQSIDSLWKSTSHYLHSPDDSGKKGFSNERYDYETSLR